MRRYPIKNETIPERHAQQVKPQLRGNRPTVVQNRQRTAQVPYHTLMHLNRDVKWLLDKLPTDIDLVAGIPRCGMIPATLIAMYWNLPLTDIHSLLERRLYPNLVTPEKWTFERVKKVLIVDDTTASGRNIKKIKAMVTASGLNLHFVYAAVYSHDSSKRELDYYVKTVNYPRIWEWDITLDRTFASACVDIDGVLCRNPTADEQSIPEKLSAFYRTVNPLIKPPKLGTVVTGRLEKYRPETTAWFRKNGIKVNEIVMIPEKGNHAEFKKKEYAKRTNRLFIESSDQQAKVIEQTGKQVIVPSKLDSKLKILTHIKEVMKPAGASITLCTVAGALAKRGHNVKISQSPSDLPYINPELKPLMVDRPLKWLYRESDIALVHWSRSLEAVRITREIPKPRVHFFCDRKSPERLAVNDAALLVFNSKWLMDDTGWHGEQMVVYPPVYPELYRTTPGDGILLVSPLYTKGIDIFLEIAKRMPDRKFYIAAGRGTVPRDLSDNITVLQAAVDPRDIYSHARLVLMPSRPGDWNMNGHPVKWVEGYGRVAIEAAASGIPTIGSRESLGLRECLGDGGMFAGQDDVQEWIDLIEKLDNEDFYTGQQAYALALSAERHPDRQIDELEERLVDICDRL